MKFIKWANSHTWIYIVIVISFVIVPLGVQLFPFIHGEQVTHGDWLGFWGGYLGFVPSGLITYMVLNFQFKRQEGVDKKNFEQQIINQKQEYLFEQEYSSLTEVTEVINEIYLFSIRNEYTINSGEVNNKDFVKDFYYNFTNKASLIDVNINIIQGWVLESNQLYNYGEQFQNCLNQILESKENVYEKRNLLQNKIAIEKRGYNVFPDDIKNFKLESMAIHLHNLASNLEEFKKLVINKKVDLKTKSSA